MLKGTTIAVPKILENTYLKSRNSWSGWKAHLLMCRNFFGRAGARPSKLLFATCYSQFAVVLAGQKPHPPISSTDSKSVATVMKPAKAGYQNWRAHLLMRRMMCRNFRSGRSPSIPKLLSLLAIRHSLPFRPCKLTSDGLSLCRRRWRKEECDHAG